ncbi:L,D-transpeptidase family protein [Terriglobus albidus]|uniref:L,D-transpeptidase family protein n=1 Tax=Terriglobus albidus TaxID=1592106 RepID=A0A5B9EIF6_9BACT|nr:L,D-transpeptidase family protein [Terriglobus albidus]
MQHGGCVNGRVLGGRVFAAAMIAVLVTAGGCKRKHGVGKTLETFSPDYSNQLQQLDATGNLPMLRWPNYTDYKNYVQNFYAMREYRLAWTRDKKPVKATTDVIHLFQTIDHKGLNPEDYDADRWQQRLAGMSSASDDELAKFDIAMTVCTMRLISDLHIGRVNPQHFDFDVNALGKRYDLPTFLAENVVDSEDVASQIALVEPNSDQYRATEEALGKYIDMAKANPQWDPLPAIAKPILPGGEYSGLQAMWQRLTILGDVSEGGAPQGNAYTAEVADVVKHFQHRHGLEENGKLGPQTIAALNISPAARIHQFQDTLERWRWLPDEFLKAPLQVNLPEFVLRVHDPATHKLDFSMRVVVGQFIGQHQTPVFTQKMKYIVFRPYWTVTTNIARKEIAPHVAKDPGYLGKKNFEVVNAQGQPVTSYNADSIAQGRVIVREKPGPKNSLGLVKFMFPNQYDIYMHSTPATQLFANSKRDFSHGCIRLQEPEKLADWVLKDQPEWTEEKIHDAMNNGPDNKTVVLKQPLPVVIFYATALVAEDGDIHFYDDVYQYDKQLEDVLRKGYPYPWFKEEVKPKTAPGETV